MAPPWASQESIVQGLPSSVGMGIPARQVPDESQVSAPLHADSSAQLVPAGLSTTCQPWSGSQTASRQASARTGGGGGVPAKQTPDPSHVSSPLHWLASPQEVPTGAE